jgi:hypothetical protein
LLTCTTHRAHIISKHPFWELTSTCVCVCVCATCNTHIYTVMRDRFQCATQQTGLNACGSIHCRHSMSDPSYPLMKSSFIFLHAAKWSLIGQPLRHVSVWFESKAITAL